MEVFLNNRTVITALVNPNATAGAPAERRTTLLGSVAGGACSAQSWQLGL